ncbi:unnamed protein product [Hydatigera taeniaeformis]|uniref:SWI/SNF-like complex subunit BAF250 C-terminal domain-containing protein n=1 Tax=Hydatigena taeniaeformis TaxID=6205 RepID=A0A0R3WNZ4_HYDTA|nr:unnamed protein product [Hydatigera taeniaeformis]
MGEHGLIPLTQLDLFTLEKYPVSRSLAKEWACGNSMEVSTQNLGTIPMVRDQQIQRPPSGKEEEHDLDGGFDSMRSISNGPTPSISSKSSITHPKCRKPLRAEHNIFFTQVPCNSGSDNSIFQQNTMNDEQEEEDFDRLRDNANNNYCEETIALEPLLESVQNEVEAINRQPNRYQALLYELSKVLQGLREQLSSSSRITANSSSHTISSRSIEGDLEKSLSMLDIAIDGSSAKFGSDVGTWAQPLTSGWNQLDSVIEWHLNHVSHLIQHLGSSNRFYTSSSDMDNDGDSNLLCITEDLLAMALDAQSEILSDITGLVLSYVEERDPFKVFINSHCLAYCGNDQRAPLFPLSFWSRFVWHTPLSVSGFSGLDGTLRPTLMIRRTNLNKFLFQEYGDLDTDDEDKQTLDSALCIHLILTASQKDVSFLIAIDNLIDKLTDLDLMDISIWDKIPLTQLCNRLKLLNFQILPKFDGQNRKLGYHNNRSGNSLTRSALNAEPSISLALNYLIKQGMSVVVVKWREKDYACVDSGKLQHELRESDEELLFRSLETLVDNLAVSNEATNRRSELMALSVENFICLAHILESEDESLTVYAGRAIHALEDLVSDQTCFCPTLSSSPFQYLQLQC